MENLNNYKSKSILLKKTPTGHIAGPLAASGLLNCDRSKTDDSKVTMFIKSKELLILDLDETLIYSTPRKLNYKETFLFENYFVYTRPYLNWFLCEISNHFRIGIWSAADELYVSTIVNQIVPNNIKLEIMWGQSWCTYKLNKDDNTHIYEKNINKLTKLNYKLEEIILVDDSIYNVRKNEGNSISIKPFLGEQDDQELKTLFDCLVLRNYSQEIGELNKQN